MQVSALSRQYLRFFLARGASARTIDCYDLTHRQYIAFLTGQGLTDDIRHFTPETVEAFATYLKEGGRKASSVNVKLAALKSLGDFGVKTKDSKGRYILAENPLTRVYRPKKERPPEKYLSRDELRALLAEPAPALQLVGMQAQNRELHAETERLRAQLEGAKRFGDIQLAEKRALQDANQSMSRSLGTMAAQRNAAVDRADALVAALEALVEQHDFGWECSTATRDARCPCQLCTRARAALTETTPPAEEQG